MQIALIGNCQVQSLSAAARLMIDDVKLAVFDYSEAYSRDEENRKRFAASLASMDIVLAQTALMTHTSEKDLRPILGDKLVTIGNFYFRGLFPDSCYIGDFAGRLTQPSLIHSAVVLDAYRCGLSEHNAGKAFNIERFEHLGLLAAWSSSMVEMGKREANGVVDVPVAEFMEEACRRYRAFLTMNHPSARLITDYLARVLRHAGIRHRVPAPDTYPDVLASHDTTPIHDFIAEHYGLSYRTDQTWKINTLGQQPISREDYIAACYNAYAQMDTTSPLVHSPTDMVELLRVSPKHYLVAAGEPVPATEEAAHSTPALPDSMLLTPRQLSLALRPLIESVDKWGRFVDRIHSYAQVMDPKVERIVQTVTSLEGPAASSSTDQKVKRLLRLTKLLILLVVLLLAIEIVRLLRFW